MHILFDTFFWIRFYYISIFIIRNMTKCSYNKITNVSCLTDFWHTCIYIFRITYNQRMQRVNFYKRVLFFIVTDNATYTDMSVDKLSFETFLHRRCRSLELITWKSTFASSSTCQNENDICTNNTVCSVRTLHGSIMLKRLGERKYEVYCRIDPEFSVIPGCHGSLSS